MNIILSILANTLSVAALAQTGGQSAPNPRAEAAPIAIKETPRARIAFLPHRGAYWSVGPGIAKVREALAELGVPAPLFIRYETDPRRVSPADLTAQIGFELEIGKTAPDGFQSETQRSELVAWMTVDGSNSGLARHYATLAAWARQNGYHPVGPVVERYPHLGTRNNGVEVQLVVKKAADEAPPANDPASSPQITDGRPATPKEPPSSDSGTPQGSVPAAPRTKPASLPGEAHVPPGSTPAPEPEAQPATATRRQGKQSAPQDFDQLALRLIPPHEEWSREQTATLGPKVMRVRAIAHLAKSRFGASAAPIAELSGALTRRYTAVWGSELTATVTNSNATSARRPTVDDPLERLDRIFSDMLSGKLDASGVQNALLTALSEPAQPVGHAFGPRLP